MYDFLVHRMLGVAQRLFVTHQPARIEASATFVFLHGIGSSHKMWSKVHKELREQAVFDSAAFISVDLLGFGRSPRPGWATYDTAIQAKSLHKALRHLTGNHTRVILVGHSLGSLVAVEYAKLHSEHVEGLVLCSPPFYRQATNKLPSKSAMLQKAYEEFAKNPSRSEKVLLSLKRYALVNEGYSIDESNAPIFIKTLTSSILNLSAYDDAMNLTVPTIILSGRLDPVVIDSNITQLAKHNPYITRKRIALAAHEISPIYRKELIGTLIGVMKEL